MMRFKHAGCIGMFCLLAMSLLLLGTATEVLAQSEGGTGQIVGTVFDSSGSVVPNAKVTVVSKETGLTRQLQTGDSGDYRAILLPPGRYTVTVTQTGFKTSKTDVEVTVGSALTVDATLIIGTASEVVEVTANPMIETTQPTASSLLDSKAIENLTLIGRRFHDFVNLSPGAQIESQRNQISFVGQRGINGSVILDGADHNEPFFGGMRGGERAAQAFSVPLEALSQFQVVSYGYSAEFGRSSGGLMNATTKSGTNDYHGSAFYSVRQKSLTKRDALNNLGLDALHQFGGSFGGPIKREKSFLFFAIEDQKNNSPRQVIFRNLDSITPTPAQLEAFNFYRGLQIPYTQTNDAIALLGKWDQQFNVNHRLAVRYNFSKNTAENAASAGDDISPERRDALENNGTEGDKVNTVAGTWTGIFSPSVVNEFRSQYSREDRPRTANALKAGVGNFIGNTGTRSFLPTTAFDYRIQASDNLSWNVGKHSFRLGGDYNYLFIDQLFKFNQFGVFSMAGSDAGAQLCIMSVGCSAGRTTSNRFDDGSVTYRLNIGNGILRAHMQSIGTFAQDSWRITPRLTLTYGFRWEGYANPKPDVSNTALYNQVKNFPFPLGLTVDPAIIPNNWNQYMPRAGVAWDPFGDAKTVIRAGAGIYYAQTPLLLLAGPLNNFRNPPGDVSKQLPLNVSSLPIGNPNRNCNTVYCQMLRLGTNFDLNTVTLDRLPTLTPQNFTDIANSLGVPFDPNRGVAPITWANNYDNPRSWQWSTGFEREVRRGWSVGADFVYINTVHLQRNRDYNLPPPIIFAGGTFTSGSTSFTFAPDASGRPCFGLRTGSVCTPSQRVGAVTVQVPVTRSRPISSLDSVQIRESNARAFYRQLTFRSVYHRNRLQFMGYYVLSENLSDDDNERDAGGQKAENAFNLFPEYGYSSLDSRHQFTFSSVANLLWGFTVSGSVRLNSARPLTPSTGSDSNGDFFNTDRAFVAPGIPFKRNSFRNRPFYNTTMRISKEFKLPREGMGITFYVDLFNLFNNKNVTYSSTGENYGLGISPTTGLPTPVDSRFRRLRNPTSCLSSINPKGNPGCYDTTNIPGKPFTAQLGLRFQF